MDILNGKTPAQLGYRMPAEWEPHSACWLSWPRREGISFPDAYDDVLPALVDLAVGISDSEMVCINVENAAREKEVRGYLGERWNANIKFFHIAINEPWCRDHGPLFLKRAGTDPLLILDWGYNAWGGKYPPFDLDDKVPTEIGKLLKLPVVHPGMILEGGSIEVNGTGTLLTTESCLLNPNRNPEMSKAQIEQKLKDFLGVTNILWLGDGIEGDDTDGHIDDLTRFVNRQTVVTAVEDDPADTNYKPLQENLKRLKTLKLEDGRPLEIVTLPMPSALVQEDMRLPASYANFYIGNKVVLLPVFEDPNDEQAIETIAKLFPGRKILPVSCKKLVWGLGTFHCLTQQQPA